MSSGSTLAQAVAPGIRQVMLNFSIYQQDDAPTQALYQAARQQSPVSVMLQLGEQAGQMFGIYMSSVCCRYRNSTIAIRDSSGSLRTVAPREMWTMKSLLPSPEKVVEYESQLRCESKSLPGVSFIIRRMSFGRRIELADEIRESSKRVEFL